MLSPRVGSLLRVARKQLAMSRIELAHRVGVSSRLVAELERGERPNVSLETALKLLDAVGVTLRLTTPRGDASDVRSAEAEARARSARAAARRQTWQGRRVTLELSGDAPVAVGPASKRLVAASRLSRQAHAMTGRLIVVKKTGGKTKIVDPSPSSRSMTRKAVSKGSRVGVKRPTR